MSSSKLRWGILGAAQIARKNWKAIANSGNATVAAVASRSVERSRQFIAECQALAPQDQVPVALGSYEELIASKDVDAVYIPLPTGLRKQWVLRAAAAGKHVLCEKPCATSVGDLREMIEACRRHQVLFMDGVMYMHSARLGRLRELLDDGSSIGRVRRISTAFSFRAPDAFFVDNIRANNRLEPHGCLGDLGWYCLRFALWVMKGQLPQCVTGRVLQSTGATRNTTGVPTEFSGELFFEGGVSSSFYCSFHTHNEQVARVSGTDGYVLVPDFVLPFYSHEVSFQLNQSVFTVSGCDFDMEPHWRTFSVPEPSHSQPNAQESNLFRTFADTARLRSGYEPWAELALKTQQMLEACFNSALNGSRLTDLV